MANPCEFDTKRIKPASGNASNPIHRKWEDLPLNCLALIFEKVDLASRTLDVPFVCKSWYEASLDPACWKILDLRDTDVFEPDSSFVERFKHRYTVNHFSVRAFLKFLVRRSNKLATKLFAGDGRLFLKEVILLWEECPELEIITWNTQLDKKLLRQYLQKIDFVMGGKFQKGG